MKRYFYEGRLYSAQGTANFFGFGVEKLHWHQGPRLMLHDTRYLEGKMAYVVHCQIV